MVENSIKVSSDQSTLRSPLPVQDIGFWYLVFTKPKQEAVARDNLLNQGYDVYLPLFKKVIKTRVDSQESMSVVREPMFPRYVFFRPRNTSQSIASSRSTRGVSSLVCFGFIPATLSNEVIEEVRISELKREQADLAEISPFQPGLRARIREKGLKNFEGLIISTSSKRVTMLVEILGRHNEVAVDHGKLELI